MNRSLLCVAALALSAGAAQADITVNFTNQTWTGLNFAQIVSAAGASGTLTGISVNATLNASGGDAWADDLTVYVDPAPLSSGGLLQVGGFSNLGAAERGSWANGGSGTPGTTVIDTYTLLTPRVFTGTAADPLVWLGNGYGGSGSTGTWTGSVTLIGLTAVPTPGAAALLGLGGLMASRRVRKA